MWLLHVNVKGRRGLIKLVIQKSMEEIHVHVYCMFQKYCYWNRVQVLFDKHCMVLVHTCVIVINSSSKCIAGV